MLDVEEVEEDEEASLLPQSSTDSARRPAASEKAEKAARSWTSGVRCVDVVLWTAASPVRFVRDLARVFGCKLLIILFVAQHLMKGLAMALAGAAMPYIFRALKVSGPRQQIFSGIASLPWAMKPIIGLITDNLPVRGYHKAPYLLIFSVLGVGAFSFLGLCNITAVRAEVVVLCFFMINIQLSSTDLLTEAAYAAEIRTRPEQGPNLLTYVWFGINFAGLVSTVAAGPLLQHVGNQAPILAALPFVVMIIPPAVFNYLGEVPHGADGGGGGAGGAPISPLHPTLFFLSLLMFAGTVALSVFGILFESIALNAAIAVAVAVVMLVAFSVSLSPMVAKVNAFFLIQTSLGLSTSGASYYFFTDGPEEYPDGPNFSQTFYVSVLGVISSLVSMLGLWTYNRYMQRWSYRTLLLVANVMSFVLSLLDVVLFTRANRKIGIPDHAFVIGSSVSQTLVYQWMWMPGTIFLSQLCPKGMEATMYALLAGCHNLGGTICSSCGALLLQHLGVSPNGNKHEGKQFDNLWKASLVSSSLSFATCILLPLFIPNVSQTAKLLHGGAALDPSHGSLWRRATCCGQGKGGGGGTLEDGEEEEGGAVGKAAAAETAGLAAAPPAAARPGSDNGNHPYTTDAGSVDDGDGAGHGRDGTASSVSTTEGVAVDVAEGEKTVDGVEEGLPGESVVTKRRGLPKQSRGTLN